MKKGIIINAVVLALLLNAPPAFAQSADVSKIQTFIQNVIQVGVTIGGLLATGFFVYGGIGYITSSGSPEALDKSKKTILYSAIGLVIVLSAFVLSKIVTDLSTTAFGGTP